MRGLEPLILADVARARMTPHIIASGRVRPAICATIHTETVVAGDKIERVERVVSRAEAIALLAIASGPGSIFGRPAIAALAHL